MHWFQKEVKATDVPRTFSAEEEAQVRESIDLDAACMIPVDICHPQVMKLEDHACRFSNSFEAYEIHVNVGR